MSQYKYKRNNLKSQGDWNDLNAITIIAFNIKGVGQLASLQMMQIIPIHKYKTDQCPLFQHWQFTSM